jgi:hypothetical protein
MNASEDRQTTGGRKQPPGPAPLNTPAAPDDRKPARPRRTLDNQQRASGEREEQEADHS